jgi:NAD(P)-dependent dehydrogenase (short-subunit alcohol dehydrogenase family)
MTAVLDELPVTPSLRLDGRRAIVTGASRGIGLASASALAGAGAEVILVARDPELLGKAASALKARGAAVTAVAADITRQSELKGLLQDMGGVDILVNCAGTNIPAPFIEVREEDFDKVMSLNLRAAFFVSQAVARNWVEARRGGVIINISSQMGHVGAPLRTVYCASKWALEGLTKAMALELGPCGIRVNTICPTFIATPLTAPFLEDEAFSTYVHSKIALGRIGKLEDIMGAVVYLASDAAALTTGASLMVDGGWTAG